MKELLLGSLWIYALGGLSAYICNRSRKAASFLGVTAAVLGSLAGVAGLVLYFLHGESEEITLLQNWFALDLTGALFLAPVFVVGGLAAIYAPGYLKGHDDTKSGGFHLFYLLTLASMTLAVVARDNLLFLLAWEIMGGASFVLVAFDRKSEEVKKASWIYLLACEAGGLILIPALLLTPEYLTPEGRFWLVAVGFGLKAGFPLLHVWLPKAHPAAPAPVSALMSAAMINLGFYGILRFGITASVWQLAGWVLLLCGIAGAFGGALYALMQKNLKSLLAFSSVENMGLIGTGLGLGFLGLSSKNAVMAAFGFAGAFIHLWNHALLKGGLFLGAGTVYKMTGTLQIDRLGGLMKKMPFTGTSFLLSSLSLSSLPPFNGFLGEFFILLSAFSTLAPMGRAWLFLGILLTVLLLALTGGFACAVYGKAVGGVFLGESRSKEAAESKEAPFFMVLPLYIFLFLNIAFFATASGFMHLIIRDVTVSFGGNDLKFGDCFATMENTINMIFIFSMSVILGIALFMLLRFFASKKVGVKEKNGPTWDCGYAKPTARMEYTGSALSQNFMELFSGILRPVKKGGCPKEFFPTEGSYTADVEDCGMRFFWEVLGKIWIRFSTFFHKLQSGSLHFYILVMVLTLVITLFCGFILPKVMEEAGTPANKNAVEKSEVKK